MKTYGLIGFPLGHSFSQKYFTEKFAREGIVDCEYRNFAIDNIGLLPELLNNVGDLCGFNVTIPYKEQVICYLNELDAEAAEVGAVNCVRIVDGRLIGYNTDVYGFRKSLLGLIGDRRPSALVLGTGGASKAICYVLRGLGIDFRVVSRTAGGNYLDYESVDCDILDRYRLIVNTTPLGTFPDVDSAPRLPYECVGVEHFFFDLVYNPALTRFLELGLAGGARVCNGSEMLEGQALRAWEIWNS